MTDRPAWPYKEATERQFRAYRDLGCITRIVAMRRSVGVDKVEEWLSVFNSKGRQMRLPVGHNHFIVFTGKTWGSGLFDYTPLGEDMLKTIDKIDGWEAVNDIERREYERLKRKFGD